MKLTSPLSLLLFLSLTTAAPILSKLPRDCLHYRTCEPWLRDLLSSVFPSKNDHTPTRLPPPHFPDHQLHPASSSAASHRQNEDEAFNNAPITPPSYVKPDLALSANRPLHSSYLLSISSPALNNPPQSELESPPTIDALPSKPTSILCKLQEEESARCWQTGEAEITITIHREGERNISSDVRKCWAYSQIAEDAYMRAGQPIIMAREYSDLLVVGIVVLFLAAVVGMEAKKYFGDLRSALSSRRRRRGAIFLEDDESAALHVRSPFSLQAAPISKYETTLEPVREAALESEKDECHHD